MTYSIIGYDPNGGAHGIACATGGPALGAFVPHLRPGVGAAITQGFSTNVLAAEQGLEALADGTPVGEVAAALQQDDGGAAWRQIVLMDAAGRSAGWTGEHNVPVVALLREPGVVVAGNMLVSDRVATLMLEAYQRARAESGDLAGSLLAALNAGSEAGGDARGTRSAALKVRRPGGLPLDLRIDDAMNAVVELLALKGRVDNDRAYQQFLMRLPTAEDPHRH
ncbi:Uncharacterized conserved protein, Ntn-hydrolase superfamily [Franzmannia pantelleriensis]|uniref:Uncharacterized conserved protein, Ntn-hydrolase superfamily n=1 Tax=Franzmannia pantelleriensis TaxID=48727 RepID=A0A1G9FGR8_9GAMM|nr:DUF1028 domain-containing protein [Halomonas pantelleriensis]SDK87537.1 Uncharacterized conserved protein, Ntn-hydrolase superfamily [Halomonas pantelleriensis]